MFSPSEDTDNDNLFLFKVGDFYKSDYYIFEVNV